MGEYMFDKLFSRHMKIERMLLSLGTLVFLISCVLIYDGVHIYKAKQIRLSDEPILSGTCSTSLTETPFKVTGVFRNQDSTQAMVVLSGDLSKTSYVAESYQVYLVGPSAEKYSGGLYIFGDLNYMCVYVTNTDGFKPEVTNLVIKSTASTASSSVNETDNMKFQINLGAANAPVSSFMSDSGLDVETMAESVFSHDDDTAIRENLKTLQADMVSARSQLNNIRKNMDSLENPIALPVFPDWMVYTTSDGQTAGDQIQTRESTGSEFIATDYIFDGAADFDWESLTRMDNYTEASGISASEIDPSKDHPDVENYIPTEWYHKDNSIIENPTQRESSLIAQYGEAIKNYYDTKLAYQNAVGSLITTQQHYLDSISDYSSNVGANALTGVKQK